MEQFFQPDRQLADPEAGRVVDGIGDRRVGADIAELTQTVDAEIVDQVIFLGDQDHRGGAEAARRRPGVLRKAVAVPWTPCTGRRRRCGIATG
jgi:hypothetical protein